MLFKINLILKISYKNKYFDKISKTFILKVNQRVERILSI